jgi:hypothetical protein
VVASNALSATPQALAPVTTNGTLLAIANQTGGTANAPTYAPAVAMYAATGSDGNTHIYGLELGNTASVPVPTQIGTLSLSPSSGLSICGQSYAQQNKATPSTLFVVVEVTAMAGQCGLPGDQFYLVNYSDAPGTAPLSVSFGTTSFAPIYQANGQLGGLLLIGGSSSLVFYPAAQLGTASPATVVGTAYSFQILAATAGGDYVIVEPQPNNAGPELLYRVSASGMPLLVYTGVGDLSGSYSGPAPMDANNLYFSDTNLSFTSVRYVALSLSTAVTTILYTAGSTNNSSVSLIGVAGAQLLFATRTVSGGAIVGDAIVRIPTATTSTAPTTLVTLTGASIQFAFLDPSSAYVLLSGVTFANVPAAEAVQISNDQVISNDTGALFFPYGGDSSSIILVSGLTTVSNGYGGAMVYNFDPAAATKTPLTLANGTAYTLPAGHYGNFYSLSSSGVGSAAQGGSPALGALYDLSKNIIVPIVPANTSVSVPF